MSSAGKNHVVYKSYETISGEMNNKSKQHSTTDKKMDNTLTTSGGAPVGIKTAVVTIGPKGPVLLDDHVFINEMAHFDRERIPERVVHAKGAGAFGYFETTHDIRKYCKAVPFQCVGKKTPIAIRFSTVGGERGSADTARDPRGFAIKFYTEEGNWDLVGNNTPIFFIRDPILFPSFIHTQKKNPQTNLPDVNMFWDFITLRPETTHQVSILFSDRGTPDGYRHMHGFGSNTFKLVNEQGEAVYCKFHYKTNQGIKCLTADQATELAGSNPDYATEDLFKAIAVGDYPSWTLSIQVMTFEEAANAKWNPFDVTKVWLQSDYPLIPVGHIVLDKNPLNYFAEIEQLAFAPSMMIPGIEPSPDKMLQGRLFSYVDTQIYRLGTNYLQIPVNCPYRVRVLNYQRDGAHCINGNQGNAPNYFPNSFSGPESKPRYVHSVYNVSGDVQKYDTVDEDNFSQAGIFWRKVLNAEERKRLVQNIANHLRKAQDFIQKRAVENFAQADYEYGQMVQEELNKKPS